jgi:hypothetical protein
LLLSFQCYPYHEVQSDTTVKEINWKDNLWTGKMVKTLNSTSITIISTMNMFLGKKRNEAFKVWKYQITKLIWVNIDFLGITYSTKRPSFSHIVQKCKKFSTVDNDSHICVYADGTAMVRQAGTAHFFFTSIAGTYPYSTFKAGVRVC